ncbi:MAG TPA: malto-oligosyltrehalose synthase [Bryobacteraceae bacterium]|nr:malto-oligosyltrehalose synthase [Bryobacteraceae bacterium]
MNVPVATYRVQLNKDFQFKDARALVPYLSALGITHLYASPIFQARKGSMHGYDITDPTRLNPELGSEAEFDALVAALAERGMALLLDIVPNHMAASPENPWWMDVLENGPASVYSGYFDIEWGHRTPAVQQKITLPILGEPYGSALEDQKLQLVCEEGGLRIAYYDTRLAVDPSSYHEVLSFQLPELLAHLEGEPLDEYGRLLEKTERLPPRTSPEWEAIEARHGGVPEIKQELWKVYTRYQKVREFIDGNLRSFNGEKGDPSSFDRLDALLGRQAYELSFWRVAREKINYRRFFDVTELIGIRAQDPAVFEGTHALVLQLLRDRKIDSLRVDHIDGLYDPLAYVARLHARAAAEAKAPVYIVVEKILSGLQEQLPGEWPVDGTTGYDFLGLTNNLFVSPEGLARLDDVYARYTESKTNFHEIAYSQKKRMLELLFAGEIHGLAIRLALLGANDRHARDLSPSQLEQALIEVTASLPVYRTYTRDFHVGTEDRARIEDALATARSRNPKIATACFDYLERVLLLERPEREEDLRFVMRWQQLTGPVMAKGVEDTTLYRYHRLISMNEVGGNPAPTAPDEYHAFLAHRRKHWPDTLNATSTHDTKRSEDVRARINLLSEMPEQWERNVQRWTRWNRSHKTGSAPDANDEYLLYQTLVGAWPLSAEEEPEFCIRMKAYMRKAIREGKRNSSWLEQNHAYEDAVDRFIGAILAEEASGNFLAPFRKFQTRIAFYGAVNSLAQTLLKLSSPGVPDFYQGTTTWDFSLVDPDNRRSPVVPSEYILASEPTRLLENWRDGQVKSFLIHKALRFRREHADLFRRGDYVPLAGAGRAAGHTLSFARVHRGEAAVIVVPRLVLGFSELEKWPVGGRVWKDSSIALPPELAGSWVNVLTGETVKGGAALPVADVLRKFPVGLLARLHRV